MSPIALFFKRHWVGLALLLLYCAFSIVGFRATYDAKTIEYPDTLDYHVVAWEPPTSETFWAGQRTLTTPFIWRIFGKQTEPIIYSYPTIPLVYTVMWAVCWGLFAFAVAKVIRTVWIKVIAFAAILGIGISKMILFWNWTLLSESPFISLTVLMLGLAILVIDQLPQRKRIPLWQQYAFLVVALPIVFLWSFTRDTNAYFAVLISLLLAAGIVFRWRLLSTKPLLVGLAIIFFVVGMFQMQTAQIGHRWRYPFVNILGQRILPNESYRQYFHDHGLPTNPETLRFTGEWASSFNLDWSGFRDWLDTSGHRTYLKFLVSHPVYTVFEPLHYWPSIIDGNWLIYSRDDNPTSFYEKFTRTVWPTRMGLALLFVVALAVSIMAFRQKRISRYMLFSMIVLLLVIPGGYVVWHGDEREVVRHSLGISLQLRLALILLTAFALDSLLTHGVNLQNRR